MSVSSKARQSTKGQAKHFIVLEVSRDNGATWGELQPFEYIEGDKFKTNKAALRHANNARTRWQDNYAQFRDARFRIVDTAELPIPAPLARLRHHVTGAIQRGEKTAIVEKLAPTDNWPVTGEGNL